MAAPLLALGRLATWIAGKSAPKITKGYFKGKHATGFGPKFVRSLYTGGKKVKVGATDYASGTKKFKYLPDVKPEGKYQKALLGTGKKLTSVGKHLKKHRRAYGWGVTGAAIWDFLPGKDNE